MQCTATADYITQNDQIKKKKSAVSTPKAEAGNVCMSTCTITSRQFASLIILPRSIYFKKEHEKHLGLS